MSHPLGVLLPGFEGTTLPSWLVARLEAGLAGVCLFGENIVDDEQVRRLCAQIHAANPAAVIAIDEEGGDVTRLAYATGSPYPGNAVLGRLDDIEVTASVARTVARRLAAVGVTLNLAPVADINSNPFNPVIGVRSFGPDAEVVTRHVAAWTAAHESVGVATSVKHFPGHGDVAVDSHLDLPVLDIPADLLRSRELAPFRAAVAAGARTVMTSHIVVPAIDPTGPATFSAPILNGLLRDELGFTGVIVSDALDMHGASGEIGIPAAAVRALAAGVDLLCIGTRNTDEQLAEIEAAIMAAIASGALPAARLADAATRVAGLAARPTSNGADGNGPTGNGAEGNGAEGNGVASGGASGGVPVTGVTTVDGADPDTAATGEAGLPDVARIAAAFDVRPGAIVPPGARVVQIETVANMAIGTAPWGLAAAGHPVETLRAGDTLPTGPLVLVGKDNHRHDWVCDIIDAARAAGPTLVVDMGWPAPDRAYADVATFGASRAVGAALAAWLASAQRSDSGDGQQLQAHERGAAR